MYLRNLLKSKSLSATNLIELWAKSSSAPIALKTYEGSREADVQAEPLESAISFKAINRDSPITNKKYLHIFI